MQCAWLTPPQFNPYKMPKELNNKQFSVLMNSYEIFIKNSSLGRFKSKIIIELFCYYYFLMVQLILVPNFFGTFLKYILPHIYFEKMTYLLSRNYQADRSSSLRLPNGIIILIANNVQVLTVKLLALSSYVYYLFCCNYLKNMWKKIIATA